MGRLVATIVATVAAATAAGCGGGGKDAAVCRREAAELGTLLTTMDYETPGFHAGDLDLVLRTDLPRTTHVFAPQIHVDADGATFRDDPIDSEEAQEHLAFEQSNGGDLVYLVIDAGARWEHVVQAAQAMHGRGFVRPGFAFDRVPAAVTKPPRTAIDDELDAILASDDGASKATELARVGERLVKSCPAMVRTFSSVAATEASKAETIVRAVEPALVECNCRIDLPAFRSFMFRFLHIEAPQSSFRVTLDPEAPQVVFPAGTPWRDAHAKLTPDARVWLVTAP